MTGNTRKAIKFDSEIMQCLTLYINVLYHMNLIRGLIKITAELSKLRGNVRMKRSKRLLRLFMDINCLLGLDRLENKIKNKKGKMGKRKK